MGWSVGLKEFREVWRSEIMEGFESEKKNLKVNTVLDREPVQLFKEWSNVFSCWGSSDNTGRVLDQLEFMDGLVG